MCNENIRQSAKGARVKLWQIAEAIGMSDSSFSRMLRHELPADEQQRIVDIINRLAKEGE